MWTREVCGIDVYHLVSCFYLFSVLGWMVESIYMSFCNKKLTNRGFMKGPFCPIYGVGAVAGYMLLHPLAGSYIKLYIVGALAATLFEFLVGKLMLRLFGEVWWDYNEKPCNYKGLICLESTLAWGVYAIIIITFLFDKMMKFIDRYPMSVGIKMCIIIFLGVFFDFTYHFFQAKNIRVSLPFIGRFLSKKQEMLNASTEEDKEINRNI